MLGELRMVPQGRALRGRLTLHGPNVGPRPCPRAVEARAGENGVASKPSLKHVYYYFDPLNPEHVVEIQAKAPPKPSTSSSNGNGNGVANGLAHRPSMPNTQIARAEEGKMLVQLQVANQQLDAARKTIGRLQQYEYLYKESKMAAVQLSAEVASLQTLVADKDSELSRQYSRMEREAAERTGLRNQFGAALEEVKALRHDLEEARAAMLELRGLPAPGSVAPLGRPAGGRQQAGASSSSSASAASSGASNSSSGIGHDVLSGLQGLAKSLAEGMEMEVGALFGSHSPPSSAAPGNGSGSTGSHANGSQHRH